jgi:hypothetical protein
MGVAMYASLSALLLSEFRLRLSLIQGGAPLLCGTRHINLYPVGASPRTKVPHATCEGTGLQGGMGPFWKAAYCSHVGARSHI